MSNVAISALPVATVINPTDIIPFVQPATAGTTRTITKTLLFTSPAIATPTITNPTVSTGTFTTPTITNPTVSTGTFTSPALVTPAIGAATGTSLALTGLATVGTTLGVTGVSTLTAGAVIQGMTVGLGSGSISSNTVVGSSAFSNNLNGTSNTAMGRDAALLNTTGGSNVSMGRDSLHSNTSGGTSTAIGRDALYYYAPTIVSATSIVNGVAYSIVSLGSTDFTLIGASSNTVGVNFVATGAGSGTGTASQRIDAYNTAIGYASGTLISTGIKNTILGSYSGNQGGLDIRTASNYVVLSDGDGNPRAYWNSADATFNGALTTTGAITSSGTAGIGYATGAGAAVTQTVSRTNPTPSINRPTGSITLFSAAGTTAYTSFTVNNNTVAATDSIILSQQSGTDKYELNITKITASTSFEITFRTTGGTTTETPVFNFAVIKGVAA